MNRRIILALAAVAVLAAGVYFYAGRKSPQITVTPQAPEAPPRDERAASALKNEIASKKAETGLRLMLIGWDAADWQIADPMLKKGRLPNLNRLIDQGARAYLRSSQPMLSPLLWNSIATGKHPTEHGILDFLVVDPQTQKPVPMNSSFRKSMALWNMLTEAGQPNAFVAWWATWPAEKTDGYIITDRVSYSLFSSVAQNKSTAGLTWPDSYYDEIKPKLVSEKDISNEELARFIHLSPAEIQKEREREYPGGQTNPVAYLAQILASTRNYHSISLDLLKRRQYALFSCYFEGIDQVGHIFQHMMPPKMEMVSEEDFRKYRDVVPRFYEYIDSLTGELLEFAGNDTVVVLMSDHGFKNGAGRPTDVAPYINERPAYWHREYGMFVLSGGPVRRGIMLDTVTLYDATPTILYLLGLPVGQDLPGRILAESLQSDFNTKFPVRTIASWEPLRMVARAPAHTADSDVDAEMMENLAALGYIGETTGKEPQASGRAMATFYRNLATIYIHEKKYDQAEVELNKSIQLGAILETYELMFEIKKGQGKPEEAGRAMQEGYDRFSAVPPESFLRLINLYAEQSLIESGRKALVKYGARLPSDAYRYFCDARLQEGAGELAGAEAKYLRALEVDPTFAYAMERLYNIYRSAGNLDKLEAPARAGLRIKNDLALYYNVLGVVYKRRGNFQDAIRQYENALGLDPDNSIYWANLAAAYLSLRQPEKALDSLLRAKSRNDRDPEIWLNLGAAYGSLDRNDEALQAFLKAKELAGDSPNIELGIAVTYAQKGNFSEARKVAQTALARYPDHPDLREFMASLPPQQ